MKWSLKISLIILLVPLSCASSKTPQDRQFDDSLYQKWMHSHEEDENNSKIYRPSNFNFPPSRGRTGFEIKENGEFIEYGIGPTDIPTQTSGTWKLNGSTLSVDFGDEKKGYDLEILSVNQEQLKLKR